MNMHNYRESFLRLLKREKPEKVVFTADITYWISGQSAGGKADPSWQTEEGYLKLHHALGVMPYYYYPSFWAAEERFGGEVIKTVDSKASIATVRWETPVGTLTSVDEFMPESLSWGRVKHPVQTKEDLDVLRYLVENRGLEPSAAVREYRSRLDLWARYDGIPAIGMPRSPLSAFVYEWAGVENAVYLLADQEESLSQILAAMESQEATVLEALCEVCPAIVHFPDNLSSENLAGYFEDHMRRGYQRRLGILHSAGIATAVHLDGTVAALLPKLAEVGFDAVEALTPKPVGDIAVDEMRKKVQGNDVVLWGGLPGAMFAPPFTWDDMRSHLRTLLDAWDGSRFVVGVADQVPPNGDLGFCPKVAELVAGVSLGGKP